MSPKFILLFLFISFSTFGQTKEIDSIVQLIENTLDFVLKSSHESDLAKLYRSSGLPEKAENTALLSIEHLKSYDKPEILARAYTVLGNLNYDKWKSSIALYYYQKVDSVLTTNKITNESLYSARLNIGSVHLRLIEDNNDKKSYLKVKNYYINALEIAKQIKDSSKIGYAYIRIGHVEKSLKNNNEALENFKIADTYISENSKYIKDLYYALGVGHLHVGDEKKATFFMRKYFDLRKNSGIPQEVAIGHWSFGRHLFNIGNYKESILHEKKSAELFNSFESIDYGRLSSVNKITYNSYEKLGDYKNAYNYFELVI